MEIERTSSQVQGAGLGTWPRVAIIILNWNGWRDTIECSVWRLCRILHILIIKSLWLITVRAIARWRRSLKPPIPWILLD
jgi:hypothetical protein